MLAELSYSTILPVALGLGTAVLIAAAAKITGFDRQSSFYPTVLIVIASYYVLFAIMAKQAIVAEVIGAMLFTIFALAGALRWPVWVGIGIILHGVFDILHAHLITNHGVPMWWPPFCASVDIVLGIWVLWLVRQPQANPHITKGHH